MSRLIVPQALLSPASRRLMIGNSDAAAERELRLMLGQPEIRRVNFVEEADLAAKATCLQMPMKELLIPAHCLSRYSPQTSRSEFEISPNVA